MRLPALVVAALALAACGDLNDLSDAQIANVVDTTTIAALTGTPIAQASAFSVSSGQAIRTDLSIEFDFAFDQYESGPVFLPRAALQIRGQQQRSIGPAQEVAGEPPHALDVPAEDDEATHADLERVGDRGGAAGEAAPRVGAERGENQAAGLEIVGHQSGVTEPSTLGPEAPVAAGTLPGCPCRVR